MLPSLDAPRVSGDGFGRTSIAFPMDATLGIDGTPQSGTGQATILTGRNGAEIFGRHFGPWVPTALRPLVRDENLLVRAAASHRSTAFANAYPAEPRTAPELSGKRVAGRRSRRRHRVAGPPLAAEGAGLLTRHAEHLARGTAVASEIVNEGWIRHLGPDDLPRPTPADAGLTLADISVDHDLTLFAHYSTDAAGHHQTIEAGVEALERVDAFLGGLLDRLPADHHLIVVSDHGNLEDIRAGHTRNPSLGLVSGPDAASLAGRLPSLLEVTPALLDLLGADGGGGGRPGP